MTRPPTRSDLSLLTRSENPIDYASCTLSKQNKTAPNIQIGEGGFVLRVRIIPTCLASIRTDHGSQATVGLLRENHLTSLQASARIKHWSLSLSTYEYTLVFQDTKAHANTDALSRLPLHPPELVLLTEHLKDSPVTSDS